ncbi:MAG: hypothetical protein K2K54_03975, partial [Lachnospiraceae bacterium]|nr:hypothetical protein [Lachnospiraceae bacterium]
LTVVFLLSGCDHNFDRMDEMDSNLNHEETAADTQAETIDVIAENPNMKVENNLPVIQPSSQLEDIIYDGEVKNLQGAVAGRENIFFYGYTENGINGIFIMKVGESAAVQSEAEWDENRKRIRCMTTDETGNCYALMVSVTEDYVDYKTMEIMIVAADGKVMGTIDISDNIKGSDWKMLLDGISIDSEGNMYIFSEADKYSVIVVDKTGELLGRLESESDRYIEGIGRGKDGAVYIVYSNVGEYSIGMIEANGELSNTHENVLSESVGKYKYIGSGTDSNLLIYGSTGSIYAYTDEAEAEERIAKSNLSFDAHKVKVLGFLADGRMVVSYLDDDNMRHFLYVPTVK